MLMVGYLIPYAFVTQSLDAYIFATGKNVTVSGINMSYQSISGGRCYGGIQRDTGMPFSIFGDVFLKGTFTIFESANGAQPRLGFARQA
jgi:aspergillopepsin I